ncbi:YcgL domain-containing protein [Pleionea sediminis]|uniref:YcgL domain-containing protein n=1 Tax=Pleionea sediminis TaxID=2569479 RepID=UPI0011863753|nr:YcgL domain-containing protein [Pleionea sediminis]
MLAFVYRSPKKDEMYLYLTQRDQFDVVPEALLKVFGEPEFALQVNLAKRDKLARENIEDVKAKLKDEGFYLQMPPSIHPDINKKVN